jgi:hypothetical protein
LKRFRAKLATGLDPVVGTGSRQENALNKIMVFSSEVDRKRITS